MIKKIFMVLLTLTALLAGTLSASAAGPSAETVCCDQAYLDLQKLYLLSNGGAESPAETFEFTIEKVGVRSSQLRTDEMPAFASAVYAITMEEGSASPGGKAGAVRIPLPEFDRPGIYTYRITERQGQTAGVSYERRPLLLTVYVTNCGAHEGQLDRTLSLVFEDREGEKVTGVTNTYSAGSLTVSKNVTGSGDKKRDFHMTVTFTAPEGRNVLGRISYTDDGKTYVLDPGSWQDGKASAELTLHDGESVTFTNIPYDVVYTVSEKEADQEGYTTTLTYSQKEHRIASAESTVTVTNHKGSSGGSGGGTVKTGDGSMPLLWAGLAAGSLLAAVLILWIMRRRKEERQ